MENIFAATIMRKYSVQYFHCVHCGFMQTEDPYWLSEAYQDPIDLTDTGILGRNYYFCRLTSVILFYIFNPEGSFLDYAGGYGIFTRLMRDVGFDFYWYDLHSNNIFARGFEHTANKNPVELVTSFESFEHFVDPMQEIEKIISFSKNIIFSTELLPQTIPAPDAWWYYCLSHGQHISFFSLKTLRHIARIFNLNLYSCGSFHLFVENKINEKKFNKLCLNFEKKIADVKLQMKTRTIDDMMYLANKI
jgi:hypothetical protein